MTEDELPSRPPFFDEVQALASDNDVLVYVIVAVTPTDKGKFVIASGAGSRLDEANPMVKVLFNSMEKAFDNALTSLGHPSVPSMVN